LKSIDYNVAMTFILNNNNNNNDTADITGWLVMQLYLVVSKTTE